MPLPPQTACQAADGSNNWGLFVDNWARQEVLWSQNGPTLRTWAVPMDAECERSAPRLTGQWVSAAPTCPSLNTGLARDLYHSTNVPTVCNCTRTAFDVCVYQLQVADVRCGSPYKVWFSQSPSFAIGERLGDGAQVSGPGRVAIDLNVTAGSATSDACSPLANAADMRGHWCVVTRGGCSFTTKVLHCLGNATNANGVVGVLVIDNVPNAPGGVPSASPDRVPFALTVPVIMITYEEGERLRGAVGSTVFTVSKSIGLASAPLYQPAGVLTRESRTGQVFSGGVGPAAARFFAEPHRLLGWAWGMRAPDKTVSNVGLYDVSNPAQPVVLLRMWTFAELGLPESLSVAPQKLVFGEQRVGEPGNATFFWLLHNGTSYVVWNVTGAAAAVLVPGGVVPATGDVFLNRGSTLAWTQAPSPTTGALQHWRYQTAWDLSDLSCPRALGSFALDTTFVTGTDGALQYPTPGRWGSPLVSFNMGADGIGFWNYSDPVRPALAAHRDTSPASCAPAGAGGPSGAIVPSTVERDVWVACQQWEPAPRWVCGRASLSGANLAPCDPAVPPAVRIDLTAYRVLSSSGSNTTTCSDGVMVNMFWQGPQ